MKRFLKLHKYRNFGMDKEDVLVLNRDLSKDRIGDLVILIGPNNSGKSNVLDALDLKKEKLSGRDKTTLSFDSDDLCPKVTFGVSDGAARLSYELTLSGAKCLAQLPEAKPYQFNYEEALREFESWAAIFRKHIGDDSAASKYLAAARSDQCKTEVEFYSNMNRFLDHERNRCENRGLNYYATTGRQINTQYDAAVNQIMNTGSELASFVFGKKKDDELSKANDYMKAKYGIPFVPTVIAYTDKSINQSDLETSIDKLDQSPFFKSVFKAIGIEPSFIKNGYSQYQQFHNKASLIKIKREIDRKIGELSNEFNRMYFAEKDEYKFSIDLDANTISFSMARGKDEDPIMIQYQSTGFRWFFDLFFNFLSTSQLNAGDIVVMDEPATHLHPEGQRELRRFLKQFAMRSGITFVIATHMPFLIDPDNYDELRVVSSENNRAHIENLFTAIDENDPDSLKPIKESLTIKQNVLYDYDTEIVWVEGITDYNYLTMFKNLLGIKNIAFLPFQGVGKNDNHERVILKSLISVKFYKRNLLLDGDAAGKAMKEKCKDTAFNNAICLTDIFKDQPNIKEIEDLFSPEDRKKYASLDKESDMFKKSFVSSNVKKFCKLEDFSEITINNFKKLFDRITD